MKVGEIWKYKGKSMDTLPVIDPFRNEATDGTETVGAGFGQDAIIELLKHMGEDSWLYQAYTDNNKSVKSNSNLIMKADQIYDNFYRVSE